MAVARPPLDLLLRGGTVVDGTGRAPLRADVAVRGGRIADVLAPGAGDDLSAHRVLDVSGRYVTPGFIDIHTHSDQAVLLNPRQESKVRQGVTTEVGGNCGSAVAPLQGEALRHVEREMSRHGIAVTWRSLGEYFDRVASEGIAANYCQWVGHGTLRASVIGYAMRPPTPDELEEMRRELEESLAAGAFGLSTGLIYAPSGYADTAEIVALARVVAKHGGAYASHIRNESFRLLEAVGEAIDVGRQAGVPVQVAHHKAAGRRNWGKVQESLASMERARAEGVDVACDQYPYVASSTGLSSILPKWALEGGRDQFVHRLRDQSARAQMRREMRDGQSEWGNLDDEQTQSGILIARCRGQREFEGRTLRDAILTRGRDPFDVVFDLLASEHGNVGCIFFSMCEEDVQTVMRWPHTMAGSDASAAAPYGPLGEGKPHPRAYGTFARILGRYVRELGVLTWPEAIRKMTSAPAARLGLRDRGILRPGAFADVVVLEPHTVADCATFAEPHQYAAGVEHVLVNGQLVVESGAHTGALPGRVLRHGQD